MFFGVLILNRSRKLKEGASPRLCDRKNCREPILPEHDYYNLVAKHSKGMFTKRLHPECLVEYTFGARIRRLEVQEEKRSKGLTSKGGRPRLDMDEEIKKQRRRLQIYCYKSQERLTMILQTNEVKHISSEATILAQYLHRLAAFEGVASIHIKLRPDLVETIIDKLGRGKCQDNGWINKYRKDKMGVWQDVEEKYWYPRNPELIAVLLERDFCSVSKSE